MEFICLCMVLLITLLSMKERRSLYDRIMSKDLSEYKKLSESKDEIHKAHLSAHARALKKWREDR